MSPHAWVVCSLVASFLVGTILALWVLWHICAAIERADRS